MPARPVPVQNINDEPKHCLVVNVIWAQFIIEMIERGFEPEYWQGDDEEITHAHEQLHTLLSGFSSEC